MMTSRILFRAQLGYVENQAASPPLALHGASCENATAYTKKKNVFRLVLRDLSEYLFCTHDQNDLELWLGKIQFHAGRNARSLYLSRSFE